MDEELAVGVVVEARVRPETFMNEGETSSYIVMYQYVHRALRLYVE